MKRSISRYRALTLVLPMQVVEQLGLRIRGKQVARSANGLENSGRLRTVLIECQGRQTADEGLVVETKLC
ncbi:hypothetical protein [Scytonema sp. UIC 10036]|uniref:hypothetical protein n=1 Tax=Scytonema sp. UIC 10036 TaxID=2304196 RepID=UPI001FA98BFE|nr:hypothetical protein [Scytonema sp. UIC 10036]